MHLTSWMFNAFVLNFFVVECLYSFNFSISVFVLLTHLLFNVFIV